MNSHYVIFDIDTGEVLHSVFCQKTLLDMYTENGKHGALTVEKTYMPNEWRVVNGELVPVEQEAVTDYRTERMFAYPSINEQLDALWHAMDQGLLPRIEPMYSQVKAVKESIPKVK
jgi:hypothetical protein